MRKKIRIRIYESKLTEKTKEIWLEKKEKHEMLISKKRILLSRESYDALIHGPYLRAIENEHTFDEIISGSMRPHIEVRYKREPFIWPHQNNLRVTFDSQIETAKNSDLRLTRVFRDVLSKKVVMEVKFLAALPYWFRHLLKDFNLERTSFSKYGRAVEKIYQYHPIPR